MPSLETTIKNAIKTELDALARAAALGEVVMDDFKISNIFDRDYGKFPAAVLTSPTIEADTLTNRENVRTYTFEIVVIMRAEEVGSVTQLEDLRDQIMNQFDHKPTLGGAADAGVEPALSPAEAITDRSRSFIVFSVILKAKAVKALTF